MMGDIIAMRAKFRGESLSSITAQIDEARTQLEDVITKFAKAGGGGSFVDEISGEFGTFAERLKRGFRNSFDGMIKAMYEGFGPDAAFAQATEQVKSLTEAVKGFIADAVVTGQDAGAAANASITLLLSLLKLKPELTETAAELQRVQGTATQLQLALEELGLTADQAAEMINSGVTAALAVLRDKFENDVRRELNEAIGQGYLNEAADLIKRTNAMRVDARALGMGESGIDTLLQLKA